MNEVKLNTWGEFKDEITRIRKEYGYFEVPLPDDAEPATDSTPSEKTYRLKNTVLFRGQGNASWPIATSLERKTHSRQMNVANYLLYADLCKNEIESFTKHSWNIPSFRDVQKELQDKKNVFDVHLPAYHYLTYLRHHGFPSPLLDWTESPYIAAYFAFSERLNSERAAIYVYVDEICGSRCLLEGAPMISPHGPYITTNPRHFIQKTLYTVATEWNQEEQQHYFCSHEKVFKKNDPEQDILIKITLPYSNRKEALRELMLDYNITPFTLFQTEDALVKTMEYKLFDLED